LKAEKQNQGENLKAEKQNQKEKRRKRLCQQK